MIHLRGVAVVCLALLAACSGADDTADGPAGFVLDPAPIVDRVALPDLSDGGTPFEFRAKTGQVLIVYFGYTHCPDVCPTTLSDLRIALNRLEESDTDRVELAMVTIDPDRDIPLLTGYVQSFVPGAHALGTDDASLLAAAASTFGATYSVDVAPDGNIDVGHSAYLYAVGSTGELLVTWPFGIPADDLATDIELLLDQSA